MGKNILLLLATILMFGCSHQPQSLDEVKSEYVTIDDSVLYSTLDYTEQTTCGYFIHMEQPEMFNKKLKAFVGGK